MSGAMGLVFPVDHGSADVWDTVLDAMFTLIEAHDHSAGKGNLVPAAALKINADVSWSFGGTKYALTDALALDMSPTAASTVASYSSALFANSDDSNNLYYRNSSGTNVKITNGASLNISIVGGIGGDYSAVGALESFDDATDSYWFQQQGSPRPWAKMRSGDLSIFEAAPSIVNSVTIKSPGALGASYTVTMPTAVPTTASMLVASTSTVLTYAETNVRTVMCQATQGAETVAGTHTRAADSGAGFNHWVLAASTNTIVFPVPSQPGDIITGYTLYGRKRTDNTHTISAQLFSLNNANFSETAQGVGTTNAGNATGAITMTESALTVTLGANDSAYLIFTPSGSVAPNPDEVRAVKFTLKRAL